MMIFFNLTPQGIFVEEVENFLKRNSSDILLKSLTFVSIFLVLMTNGSLIYFIIRKQEIFKNCAIFVQLFQLPFILSSMRSKFSIVKPTSKSQSLVLTVHVHTSTDPKTQFFFRLDLNLGSEFWACWDRVLGTWTRA